MQLPKHSRCAALRARPGFTLVELMVVIAIIGVVAALATSAALQVVARQKANNTELTIRKVSDALQAHWKAVVDQAKNETIPDSILYGDGATMQGLLKMAGGDPKRARVIWIKLRLKQQFPMNFMEALDPTPNTIRYNGLPFVLLPPAPVFSQALLGRPTPAWPVGQTPPPTPLAAAEPQVYESSVCLLLALSQGRKGAAAFNQDRLASTELADSQTFNPSVEGLKVIVDAWGRPLTFYRWPKGDEITASNPYKTSDNQKIIRDPLDPDALLMDAAWNMPQNYQRGRMVWAFERLFHPLQENNVPTSFYTVPVVASAGPVPGDKSPLKPYLNVYDFMGLLPPTASAFPPLPPALLHDRMDLLSGKPDSFDNIYSFRMRLGARGD